MKYIFFAFDDIYLPSNITKWHKKKISFSEMKNVGQKQNKENKNEQLKENV